MKLIIKRKSTPHPGPLPDRGGEGGGTASCVLSGAGVRELPILFSGSMVRAILEGTKSQTRRVVKPELEQAILASYIANGRVVLDTLDYEIPCPYGKPGDRLWVRETWAIGQPYDSRAPWQVAHLNDAKESLAIDYAANAKRIWSEEDQGKWRPSIHMPRWASRILLEVVSVRVERVQEISEADALAEGVQDRLIQITGKYVTSGYLPKKTYSLLNGDVPSRGEIARANYGVLWDSLNAERGFGWEKNPWVWVVEFKRVEGKGK